MTKNNKSRMANKELSIVDLLCSSGFLPPRDEQDVERFERIYRGRKFETESYTINTNAIFEKVTGEEKGRTRRVRQRVNQSLLRAASGIKLNGENCFTDILYQDMDNKE